MKVFDLRRKNSWGSSIGWLDLGVSIVGHIKTKPTIGDMVISEMSSGKLGAYEVVSVTSFRNPSDQFFAKVKPLYYCDENGIELK